MIWLELVNDKDEIRCSFCGKTGDQVTKDDMPAPAEPISVTSVWRLCAELIEEEFEHDEAQAGRRSGSRSIC